MNQLLLSLLLSIGLVSVYATHDIDYDKSLCRVKVGELAEITGVSTVLGSNPSVCSLTVREFSELSGFAFDGSSMTDCYWNNEYDNEYANPYYGGSRYKGYRPICRSDNDDIMVQGFLWVETRFDGGSYNYYQPETWLQYHVYTYNSTDDTYTQYYHYNNYPTPVSPDVVSYNSTEPNWDFSYTIEDTTTAATQISVNVNEPLFDSMI